MSRSLSDPTGSFPAPHQKESQPVEAVVERDQPWYELTDEEYQSYHRTMWNRAYLASGSANEADDIINKVIDEVLRYEKPPSKAMIGPILNTVQIRRTHQ